MRWDFGSYAPLSGLMQYLSLLTFGLSYHRQEHGCLESSRPRPLPLKVGGHSREEIRQRRKEKRDSVGSLRRTRSSIVLLVRVVIDWYEASTAQLKIRAISRADERVYFDELLANFGRSTMTGRSEQGFRTRSTERLILQKKKRLGAKNGRMRNEASRRQSSPRPRSDRDNTIQAKYDNTNENLILSGKIGRKQLQNVPRVGKSATR